MKIIWFMLINCWILDNVCIFLNKTFRWFKYVCNKTLACKISARFHCLAKMSRDQNDQDRKVPWPERLRLNRPDRKFLFRFQSCHVLAKFKKLRSIIRSSAWCIYIVGLVQWFSAWGSWTIFGGANGRYFMYRAVLHLLYSSFRWGLLG